ncbi:MAG: hypothetical protein WDM89_19440 [Rhizomicrobium sp.]
MVAALAEAFAASEKHHVLLRTVMDKFNDDHEIEYGYPMTAKWVGYMVRVRLGIATHKSGASMSSLRANGQRSKRSAFGSVSPRDEQTLGFLKII